MKNGNSQVEGGFRENLRSDMPDVLILTEISTLRFRRFHLPQSRF